MGKVYNFGGGGFIEADVGGTGMRSESRDARKEELINSQNTTVVGLPHIIRC